MAAAGGAPAFFGGDYPAEVYPGAHADARAGAMLTTDEGWRLIGGLLVTLVVLLLLYWRKRGEKFTLGRTRGVPSRVDGLTYRVHLAHADPQYAADTMAFLNRQATDLMRVLRKRYLRSPAGAACPRRREATVRLLRRYNPDNLAENSPRDPEGDTSYTIDKGLVVALCLREKNPEDFGNPNSHDFHDRNTLTFVLLHELTHIAIEAKDHPPVFWEAFRFILQEAADAGIYTPEDYAVYPRNYCGMDLNYNPLYESSIGAFC